MKLRSLICMALLLIVTLPHNALAAPLAGDSGFWYRLPLIIDNTQGKQDLVNYQVRIALGELSPKANAGRAENADVRFTDKDTGALLPYWLEKWGLEGKPVVAWVKVPYIKAGTQKAIYYHYYELNPTGAAYPERVFDFFDDFGTPGTGYFKLSPPQTIMTKTQEWESAAPHTLSMVELNRDGYRYWSYYGLSNCGGIGLARSNDLTHWDKYSANPVIKQDGERWPSVVKVGDTLYMAHTRDYCTTSHIVLRKSKDGTNFGAATDYTLIISPENGISNQNPNLFYDQASQQFYLYWFRGGQKYGVWEIRMRSAATAEGLAQAHDILLIIEPYEIAAPHMMTYGGIYYLATEVNENAWKTRIYAGQSATGPFKELPGNPILGNNEACFFQHVISDTLYAFYCKDNGDAWVINSRTANLAGGRQHSRQMDESKWDVSQAGWSIVLDAVDPGRKEILSAKSNVESYTWSSAYKGSDYIVDLSGRLAEGALWSVGVRSDDARSMYRLDLRPGEPMRMSVSRWANGTGTVLGEAQVPQLDLSQWFTLSIALKGTIIETQINGKAGVRANDAQIKEGRLTLISPPGSTVMFDDVRVRKTTQVEPGLMVGKPESWNMEELRMQAALQIRKVPPEQSEGTGAGADMVFLIALGVLGVALAGGVSFVLWRRRSNRFHW